MATERFNTIIERNKIIQTSNRIVKVALRKDTYCIRSTYFFAKNKIFKSKKDVSLKITFVYCLIVEN